MSQEKHHSLKFEDLEQMRSWINEYIQNDLNEPHLILLSGDLGAGKTQFVTFLAEALGCAGEMASPSFSIINEYKTADGVSLSHVDLYRLENAEDLESTGFWDLLREPSGYIAVEWANRLSEDAWPSSWSRSFIEISRDQPSE